MQIHLVSRKTKNTKRMTVGRGGKRGKTSGRGTKGQKARAGHKIRPELRDFIKRLPKLRGRGKNSFQSFQKEVFPVKLGDLEKSYKDGEKVTPSTLSERGIIRRTISGGSPRVKILSEGDLTKKLIIKGCAISLIAREKIEKLGGSVEK